MGYNYRCIRGCLGENDRSGKEIKSGQLVENMRRIVNYLTSIFGKMDNFPVLQPVYF